MDKDVIKQVVLEQERAKKIATTGIEREQLALIDSLVPLSHVIIISGVRRCGKSTLIWYCMSRDSGHTNKINLFHEEIRR
jgi:uncharacterized protein